MNPDVLTIPTEWQKHGDVWRRAVALVQVGEGLPEIARIVVVEMPGDMDPSVVKVFTLTPFPVGRAQMTARTQDPQGASRPTSKTVEDVAMTQTDKQAQPTPGPWTVDALTNGFAVSSKGADAPWPPHVADVWREADARLIAAAPRMLKALEDLCDAVESEVMAAGDDDHPTIATHSKVAERARALLREIHGDQP